MGKLEVAGGITNCECCGKTIPVGYMCCPKYLKLKARIAELEDIVKDREKRLDCLAALEKAIR